MVEGDKKIVVIDSGTGIVKAGFAGADKPQVQFTGATKDSMIGDAAWNEGGKIANSRGQGDYNWEEMELLWGEAFKQLEVNPSEIEGVMLTGRITAKNPQKYMQIMLEKFEVNNVYLAWESQMVLYQHGRTTGLVLDGGDGLTWTMPVFEGFTMAHGSQTSHNGGRDLTEWVHENLIKKCPWANNLDLLTARDIKEKCCQVTNESYVEKIQSEGGKEYVMPDGNSVTIPWDICLTPCEQLFTEQTENIWKVHSMQRALWNTLQKVDVSCRSALMKNVLISGGNTMFEGFSDRLHSEVMKIAPEGSELRIISTADRGIAPFRGASILSALSSFKWISKEMYAAQGAEALVCK